MPLRRLRPVHEQKVQLVAATAAVPAIVVALWLLWAEDHSDRLRWALTPVILLTWIGFVSSIGERIASPLRTLSNLLEAMREGDYSIRARGASSEDALGEVMQQVNYMGATLRAQRLGALEATTLLRKVMEEINVAIFAFDGDQRLRLVNEAGQRLLRQPSERLLGMDAGEIGLTGFLQGETSRTVQQTFPAGAGRWGISRGVFRERGLPHQLLVITDLTEPLRAEEIQAWQRLVRVLGHELNNSLTPIKSIAESLSSLLSHDCLPSDWREDMTRGLHIIATRSESLSRFLGAYARLARLPSPKLAPIAVGVWLRRIAPLDERLQPELIEGPPVILQGDSDQLDQVLINLLRNAVDASIETGGRVQLTWSKNGQAVAISVLDEGPGLSNTANLFVPFFTTKAGGSGIGLVLSRQIAEAHGGTLTLQNRASARGCEAVLTLPL